MSFRFMGWCCSNGTRYCRHCNINSCCSRRCFTSIVYNETAAAISTNAAMVVEVECISSWCSTTITTAITWWAAGDSLIDTMWQRWSPCFIGELHGDLDWIEYCGRKPINMLRIQRRKNNCIKKIPTITGVNLVFYEVKTLNNLIQVVMINN